MRTTLLLASVLVVSLGSCKSTTKAADAIEPVEEVKVMETAALPEIVLSFEQTACFGNCPVHKMVIHGNGTATYTANRNTKITGDFQSTFSKKEVDAIISTIDSLQFFSAENEYTQAVTDLPTSIIYVNTGKQKKQVIAYYGYPENIESLIKYLYQITQSKKWAAEEK